MATGTRLGIAPVTKRIGDATVRMLAYNGSIPGPTLRVPEGAELVIDIENEGRPRSTVHWHGLRLDNRYDGTHETQELIPIGGRYTAQRRVPGPGRLLVSPARPRGLRPGAGPVRPTASSSRPTPTTGRPCIASSRSRSTTCLIEDGQIAAFSPDETTYAAMGRFGNVLLVAGEPELALTAQPAKVVRLYLTNTANTRVFKVALPGRADEARRRRQRPRRA
jgi:FtsP/CotA-like multicopper oxidase with cupredoxin domain